MKVLLGVVGTLVVLAVVGLVVIYSGLYNVAATNAHTGTLEWLLHTTMTRSVRRYAADVPPPPPSTQAVIAKGANLYAEMCAQCHGAPGITPDETGKGLMPRAPDLAKTADAWTDREVFWIIKNGVQFTGMPAWGETHSDAQVWELTHFVKALPTMNAEQYRKMAGKQVRRLHSH